MTSIQTALDAIALGSQYALYALGVALIFGIMNLINFAYGELIMAAGFTLIVATNHGVGLGFAILLSLAVAIALALLTERVAFRPIRGANAATLLITSFAVSYLLQNIAILIFTAVPQTLIVGSGLTTSFDIGGVHVVKLDLVTIGIVAGLIVSLGYFLRKTHFGAEMRAAAEDFEMARLLGVRANRVIGVAFALSGVTAAAAAFLLAVQTGFFQPTTGLTPVLYAFVATVLGGLGTLIGPALAGFGLGVLTVVLQVSLPTELLPYRDTLVFAGVLVLLVVRPQGLIVSRSRLVRV
jgi:branched-chain amino acid transport system permease protein